MLLPFNTNNAHIPIGTDAVALDNVGNAFASGVFTAPVTGLYQLNAMVHFKLQLGDVQVAQGNAGGLPAIQETNPGGSASMVSSLIGVLDVDSFDGVDYATWLPPFHPDHFVKLNVSVILAAGDQVTVNAGRDGNEDTIYVANCWFSGALIAATP